MPMMGNVLAIGEGTGSSSSQRAAIVRLLKEHVLQRHAADQGGNPH